MAIQPKKDVNFAAARCDLPAIVPNPGHALTHDLGGISNHGTQRGKLKATSGRLAKECRGAKNMKTSAPNFR
jgi:hypothetical protein